MNMHENFAPVEDATTIPMAAARSGLLRSARIRLAAWLQALAGSPRCLGSLRRSVASLRHATQASRIEPRHPRARRERGLRPRFRYLTQPHDDTTQCWRRPL